MNLEQLTVTGLPAVTGLNPESARDYFAAKLRVSPLLKKLVISPFEELLKSATGYSNDNLPRGKSEDVVSCGDFSFTVTSEQRTKRPAWAEVFTDTQEYLGFIAEGHSEGVQRRGVRTFDDRPYLAIDEVVGKITGLSEGVKVDEVKQSITSRQNLDYTNDPLVVPLTGELGLIEADARLYLNAVALQGALQDAVVKPFESALKAQTGYDNSRVPAAMEEKWVQVGENVFGIQTIPEETVRYAAVINDLVKAAPSRITARSKFGELTALREGLSLASDIVAAYAPRVFGGDTFVSVAGVQERLGALKTEHTKTTVNQKIAYFPAI